jgi:ribosome-binding factor A
MPREFDRAARLGSQIRRDLAGLLQREIADPRLASVTVSEVEVARDLTCARVHVQMSPGEDHEETLRALRRAARYLRTRLAGRLRVRNVPELRFEHDRSPETASRIERLLAGPEGLDGP